VLQVKRTLAENYDKVKRTLTEDYEIISWLLRIFLGGTINIGILNATYAYLSVLPSMPSFYAYLIDALFLIFAVITPFLLSLILTAIQPEPKIVPPFYITLISFAWLFVLWVNPHNVSATLTPTITLGLFYVALGFAEDKLTTSILGIATERESIFFEHLTVVAEIEDVKARLIIPEIRRRLYLSERVEGNAEQGYLFKSIGGFIFKNQILLTKNKDSPQSTDLKVVYYEQRKYNLTVSRDFFEQASKNLVYLYEILYNRTPSFGFYIVTDFTNKATDPLIDKVIDDLRGYYVKSKQFSNADKFKVVMFVGILILTAALFLIEQPLYGELTIAIEVLLLVFELPDVIRRQKA
jgi:hypothetical protein